MKTYWMLTRHYIYGFVMTYCFLDSAERAFVTHDRFWAAIAALLIGNIGVNLRRLSLAARAKKGDL
jgi:hypothetical protein